MIEVLELSLTPGPTSLTATWGASTEEGLAGWLVSYRKVGDVAWIPHTVLEPTERSVTFTGLLPETEYEVQVEPLGEEEEAAEATATTGSGHWILLPWARDTGRVTPTGWVPTSADSGAYYNQWFGEPEAEPEELEEPEGEEAAPLELGPHSAGVVPFSRVP